MGDLIDFIGSHHFNESGLVSKAAGFSPLIKS